MAVADSIETLDSYLGFSRAQRATVTLREQTERSPRERRYAKHWNFGRLSGVTSGRECIYLLPSPLARRGGRGGHSFLFLPNFTSLWLDDQKSDTSK